MWTGMIARVRGVMRDSSCVDVHGPRRPVGVDEDGHRADRQDRGRARDDRERRHDHLVARLEVERRDRRLSAAVPLLTATPYRRPQ